MSGPAAPDFIRYLAAKQGLDDRSLNRHVWDHLVQAVRDRPDSSPLRVLEVGCGIGTMVERLLDRGLLTRAAYTGIDVEPEFIRAAAERLHDYAAARQAPLTGEPGGAMLFSTPAHDVRITLEAADLFDFLDREPGKSAWDLLIAHAVLDLIDLPTALPRLLSRLSPGGFFYFTLNFDGGTTFEPPIDPDLDALIEALYHRHHGHAPLPGPALGQQSHRAPPLRAPQRGGRPPDRGGQLRLGGLSRPGRLSRR